MICLALYPRTDMIGRIMLGLLADAAFRLRFAVGRAFLFSLRCCSRLDAAARERQERRLAVLSPRSRRQRTARDGMHFHSSQFLAVFEAQWKLLPVEEAVRVTREIVRATLDQPDRPVTANYDPQGSRPKENTRCFRFSILFGRLTRRWRIP